MKLTRRKFLAASASASAAVATTVRSQAAESALGTPPASRVGGGMNRNQDARPGRTGKRERSSRCEIRPSNATLAAPFDIRIHIAYAAAHGMDFLLTWNCRHILNAFNERRLAAVCAAMGMSLPVLCTPPESMADYVQP